MDGTTVEVITPPFPTAPVTLLRRTEVAQAGEVADAVSGIRGYHRSVEGIVRSLKVFLDMWVHQEGGARVNPAEMQSRLQSVATLLRSAFQREGLQKLQQMESVSAYVCNPLHIKSDLYVVNPTELLRTREEPEIATRERALLMGFLTDRGVEPQRDEQGEVDLDQKIGSGPFEQLQRRRVLYNDCCLRLRNVLDASIRNMETELPHAPAAADTADADEERRQSHLKVRTEVLKKLYN